MVSREGSVNEILIIPLCRNPSELTLGIHVNDIQRATQNWRDMNNDKLRQTVASLGRHPQSKGMNKGESEKPGPKPSTGSTPHPILTLQA